jgi:phosphoribosylcarboxyaminoimidazole (NCAIR) mutase
MPLLNDESRRKRLHLILGSTSDAPVGKLVAVSLGHLGCWPAVHVLSCHRNPDETRAFAEEFAQIEGRKALIGVGGLSYQAPAVLASHFLRLGVQLVIFGIPVGDSLEKLQMAYSAMHDLPLPLFIHSVPDHSKELVEEVTTKAVGYINGTIPSIELGESEGEWQSRLTSFRNSIPRMNVDINHL